jgi:sigma-B regulation protein RsbU (phosphoserine phosphatase)
MPITIPRNLDISDGQIIFLSTDGIWEARNKEGEMFGKEPILNAIRYVVD